jgi:hypothetical protein
VNHKFTKGLGRESNVTLEAKALVVGYWCGQGGGHYLVISRRYSIKHFILFGIPDTVEGVSVF